MNQDEYNALVAQHGGVQSQIATGPTQQPDPAFDGTGVSVQRDIPAEQRQQRIVFKDGYYMTVQPQQDGTVGIVEPLAKSAAATSNTANDPITRTDGQGNIFAWDPKTSTWSQLQGTETKKTQAEQDAASAQAQEDQREREYNSTHPDANGNSYYLTHAELDALHQKQSAANLSDKQAQAQIANMEADNKRLDAQLQVSQTNADTSKISAQASLQNAQTNSKATDAQIAAEQAAAQLAKDQLDWKKQVDANAMSAEDAKQKYQEAHDHVLDLANQARLLLDQQTEADKVNSDARSQANSEATQAETARHNKADEGYQAQDLAEKQREADQTAEQNRQAEAERIGEAGAQALQSALPFMAPTGTSADLDSIRNGMLSNPAHPQAAPPTRSVPFPYDPATIVQQLTAQALANLSPTAKAIADKAGAPPPAPVAPTYQQPQAQPDLAAMSRPLLGPGMAGTADDPGLGATPPGAFPITPAATPFAQSGLPEGRGAPVVNLHFYAPGSSPTPGQRGSLDSGPAIDPMTGQPVDPFQQGVTI